MRIETLGAGLTAAAILLASCSSLPTARERLVQAPARCSDQSVAIYFDPDSAELTLESEAVIKQASASARGCKVERVEVLGLADAAGAPEANLELSKRRAQSVTAALATAGLPSAEFHLAAAGDAGATTPDGAARPLRRRVDVTLRMEPVKKPTKKRRAF